MAEKIAFKRYKDAQKVFKCALIYVSLAGGAVALLCYFGAPILVPDSMSGARLPLRMLAPTIFLSGILGVFRGYFQAYRNMMPTSLSQIIEQIFVAVMALAMSRVMISHFSGQSDVVVQSWGAAGATMGTGAGVFSALIFMLLVYQLNRRTINKRIQNDHASESSSTGDVMRNIILVVMPIVLSAFIYNVNGTINSYMYSGIDGLKGLDDHTIQTMYAEYSFYMTLINIPLTLASTAPTSMIPEVSAHYAMRDMNGAREKIDKATWLSMFISIPCSVGLAVLAGPITRLLFPRTNGVAGGADDPWRDHHYPEWQFQYFQWCASGNRKAEYSYVPCSYCSCGRCDRDGCADVCYKSWGIYHCDRNDRVCHCNVCFK